MLNYLTEVVEFVDELLLWGVVQGLNKLLHDSGLLMDNGQVQRPMGKTRHRLIQSLIVLHLIPLFIQCIVLMHLKIMWKN